MVSTDSLAVRLGDVGRTANITVYVPNDLGQKLSIFGGDNIGNSEESSPFEQCF